MNRPDDAGGPDGMRLRLSRATKKTGDETGDGNYRQEAIRVQHKATQLALPGIDARMVESVAKKLFAGSSGTNFKMPLVIGLRHPPAIVRNVSDQ